ncbi:hypothetical protein [Actinokineospora globicatena]|uniref:WXG100 family type VII secretion target n=1 Tax=Actinokineospora globicatena TaxID=103729 RepID=A0A9W6QQN0_9PSEU|nr:hypothetical protein [Actinokineospora globicatena]MCP2306299.1 hypothetical protein [Actinokineospora globicatena]GLW81724.1 hypothetical protein Aglo01_62050 [Actinokineospora globicatena]GLW88519.1 hypothetical protein Aglo02_61580 [Actinokineospora globicatena]GLW95146.1 hypothetical protein Aglo03_59620 [Actinokineospora globicatena]
MTSGFEMDPAAVTGGAGGFGTAGDLLGDAATRLTDGLSAQGACWGGDESGKTFAKDYVPAVEGMTKAFGDLAAALQAIKKALTDSVASQQGTDTSSGDGLTAIRG